MSKKSVFEFHVPTSQFSIGDLDLVSKSAKKIVLADADGDRLIYEGSGLTYKNGLLRTGVIDTLTVESGNDKTLFSFTHVDVDAATLPGVPPEGLTEIVFVFGLRHDNLVLGSKGADELVGMLGNDILKGFAGNDQLEGGFGNDVMTGGGGQDEFQFWKGSGKDRITDFDADFLDGKQDLINADQTDIVSIKTVKGNAVINFGGGDTLTLIGVKAGAIDETDFVV